MTAAVSSVTTATSVGRLHEMYNADPQRYERSARAPLLRPTAGELADELDRAQAVRDGDFYRVMTRRATEAAAFAAAATLFDAASSPLCVVQHVRAHVEAVLPPLRSADSAHDNIAKLEVLLCRAPRGDAVDAAIACIHEVYCASRRLRRNAAYLAEAQACYVAARGAYDAVYRAAVRRFDGTALVPMDGLPRADCATPASFRDMHPELPT